MEWSPPFSLGLLLATPSYGSQQGWWRLYSSPRSCRHRHRGAASYRCIAPHRGDLTEVQWKRMSPLLPPEKPWVGRPAQSHRRVLGGICWVLCTGSPWRDMPKRYRR
ncbi:transposase [Corallococcus macrosporus]|uniref:transposase n=1 Tax=Corallococcus macrosporus TaxID=35 RepID=UPI003D6D1A0F